MRRPPRCFNGTSFAFVARGYSTDINRKARQHSNRGYTYRIVRDGRHRLLYVGPKRTRTRARRKDGRLKRR